LTNWGVRRDARLLHRLLLEFIGTGSEGGLYACPFGEVELTDIGRRLIIKLRRGIRWSAGDDHLTGFDVARQLMSLADPSRAEFEPAWADLFAGVEVQDVYEVGVDLRWSYVQPLALLETPLSPVSSTGAASSVGPYVLGDNSDGQVHFLANPAYFAAGQTQPKEIVERYVADSKAGWAALDRGDIQLLDRLNPWEVDKFRSNENFVVEQYAIPTIHCLVPNPGHSLMTHGAFRRALTYGINREVVLKHHLLHDVDRSGCRVVSGPFPIGNGFDDPLRYAYNSRIEPRPWDPRLALALSAVALIDVSAAAQKRGEPEIKELPPLTLAHPAEEVAREACRAIQRHLKTVKINVTLRELPPGQCRPTDDNYDLFYMQMMMQEPLVDAGRLLGADGAAGQASAYVTLALSQLGNAANWRAASDMLHRIHALAADGLAVIPLWQLTEHFAYHRSIKGISTRPVLLYQDVEQWEGKVLIPPED
jgi:ABC-type transport system substrate-binding protein